MRQRSSLILCAWHCALLLGGTGAAGPAAAQAQVTPIELAAPQARALEEPAAPAASAPAARADQPASTARAAGKANGEVSGSLPLTLGGAVLLAAIAALLQRLRSRRRKGAAPPRR
ncbi:hypothetical protein P3W85_17400 [Cupriavidus basilensis]|uniref:Uncharacterized protein n=1 Tax=Cupriavidus basilensis TaxID=68895 RepID=A0ABT6AQ33_9BURK|nr:hypothetical protein [Cupriavidus basilensis]MDF3834721.1 hypothetical protein [Cupriavidus basilensis]